MRTDAFGTTHDDNFASFSNYGQVVDLSAPGVNVLTTGRGNPQAVTVLFTGTSASSPHVAGAAALYKSLFPGASPSDVRTALMNSGSTPSTVCDGNGHGYLTINPSDPGDPDNSPEPLLYVGSFTSGDTTPPAVVRTVPSNGATGVTADASKITVTFNEGLRPPSTADVFCKGQWSLD